MPANDRIDLLEQLGQRHDALLVELEQLNDRIEAALAENQTARTGATSESR